MDIGRQWEHRTANGSIWDTVASQQLGHAAEVMADDGQFEGVMELTWLFEECCDAESPVGKSSAVPDSQQPQGFEERLEVRPREPPVLDAGPFVLQESVNALVVVARLVELSHQFTVATDEKLPT